MNGAVPLLPPVCALMSLTGQFTFAFDRFIGSKCNSCKYFFEDFAKKFCFLAVSCKDGLLSSGRNI
jgi:hypothetical protein